MQLLSRLWAGKAFAAEAEAVAVAVAPAFDANTANGRVQYKCYTARASYQTFQLTS